MSQETLPGFEAYDNIMAGLQEKATTELIQDFVCGRKLNSRAVFICKTMVNIARNFDVLNAKGRDSSRVMGQLLLWFQELNEMFPAEKEVNPALAGLLQKAKA